MTTETISHFRILEKIGEGGMGEVYRALDTRLRREVALKLLSSNLTEDPERLAKIRREAQTVAALNHPNIVTIYSIEDAEGSTFINMELVRGKRLTDVIPAHGLALDRFFDLAIPMADAVTAAHNQGIIHRDLKPSNVMVGDEGRVTVLDFGLAQFREPDAKAKAETITDASQASTRSVPELASVQGTLPYMSPEQVRGLPLDHRSDIFSLGIILYELATGQRPFQGDTPADVIASILRGTPTPVCDLRPELPRQLARIIGHCVEKPIEHRLQSALDLRNQLNMLRTEVRGGQAADLRSIAVLPFADMSRERDQGYFCEGVAEEVINALGKIHDLRVASRTSSFQFQDAAMDSREIGRRLGVSALVEGSVRKAGDQLRITAELIDVANGYALWSERYDRELQDIFSVQDEIACSVARSLEIRLSPQERFAIAKALTTDLQAYDYYLRGRQFYYLYKRQSMEFALQMFHLAIEKDPDYARAYAGITDCCAWTYMNGDRSQEKRECAETSSAKALDLDPELAEAHASRGLALSLSERYEDAEKSFETATQLNPGLWETPYYHARMCFTGGESEKAIALYERSMEVRPDDYQAPLLVAQIYDDLGRKQDAADTRRRGIEIARARLSLNPDDARALYMAANGMVALGDMEQGLEWARRALTIDPDEPMVAYNVACIQSLAGKHDEALDSLEQAFVGGLTARDWVLNDSNLDPLRDHPPVRTLMKQLDAALGASASRPEPPR